MIGLDRIDVTAAADAKLGEWQRRMRAEIIFQIAEQKSVPGEDRVEISAQDIESRMAQIHPSAFLRRRRAVGLTMPIALLYLLAGILLFAVGLLKPNIEDLVRSDPLGLMLLSLGASLTLAGTAAFVLAARSKSIEGVYFSKTPQHVVEQRMCLLESNLRELEHAIAVKNHPCHKHDGLSHDVPR